MHRRDLLRSSAALASSVALGGSSALGHQVTPAKQREEVIFETKIIHAHLFQEFWSTQRKSGFTKITEQFPSDFVCSQENINILSKINGSRTSDFMQYFYLNGFVTNLNSWRNLDTNIYISHTKFTNGLKTFHIDYTRREKDDKIDINYDRKTYKNGLGHDENNKPSWIGISSGCMPYLYWHQFGSPTYSLYLEEANTYIKEHLLEDLRAEFEAVFNRPLELPSEFGV